MTSTYKLLFKASFKGVPFLPEGAITTTGGRKLIDHTYPNSSRRFIEDLGKTQQDFQLVAVIQGPNYFAKRKQLINTLEEGGQGRLVHPFFGSVSVVARQYSLVEDLKSVGEGRFSITFSVPSKNIFPTSIGLSNIGNFFKELRDSINDILDFDFSIDFSDTLLAAEQLIDSVIGKFDEVARNYAQLQENIDSFNNILDKAKNELPQLIRDTTKLNLFFNETFEAVNELYDDPRDTFGFLKSLFGFEGGDNSRPNTTAIRTEQNKNNDVINQAINVLALGNAYLNANLIGYKNDQDLDDINSVLDNQFNNVIETLDDPAAKNLYELRDNFEAFRQNLLITLDKVIDIKTEKVPVLVLTHAYYGTTENYDEVIDLNNTLNPSLVEGEYKVLSQ